jgi:hypothetical protein
MQCIRDRIAKKPQSYENGFACHNSRALSKCGSVGVEASDIFSVGTRIKNCGNIKPDNAVGKTACKWKASDKWNSRLERESCTN